MSSSRLALFATLLASAAAQAAPRVAALVPTLRPAGAPEVRDRFHEAVTRGLAAGGVDTVPAAELRMRLAVSEEQLACSGPGVCAARAAMTLRTDRLVATEVVVAGKDYTIRLKLIDTAGREVAHAEETCDICTVKEADEAATRVATKLATVNRVILQDSPGTAPGAPIAPTPPPKVEPTPPPKVEPAPAPRPAPAAVVAPPLSRVDRGRKPFPWRSVAIGSAAAGLVGIAIGIPLVVIDGRYTDCPAGTTDPMRQCKQINQTLGGGATVLTLGLAGAAASGVLFYLDYRSRHRKPAPQLSIVPLEGGAFATVGGRF